MVPKTLHYCFGMSPDFGRRPWSLVHYACLKSAVQRIHPAEVIFHCEYEPAGPWWDLTRPMVRVEKIKAPREIFGKPLRHTAHRADVVRLQALLREGGIYLDSDVFVHRGFDDLLGSPAALGEQRTEGAARGLCNAVILAEPKATFLRRWLSEYRSFRSAGRDAFWDEHSVRIPYVLSQSFRDEVTILPESAFFWPPPVQAGLKQIFGSPESIDLSAAYATHLWESVAWERHLADLTPKRVRSVNSNFHRWVRPLIQDLPDGYGRQPAGFRVRKRLRSIQGYRARTRRAVSYLAHAASRAADKLFPESAMARYYRQRVFRDVYAEARWGSDGRSKYFSGVGSVGPASQSYIDFMVPVLREIVKCITPAATIVDLGCGDFRMASQLLERLPGVPYIGCDIVPGLIEENQAKYGSTDVSFRCLDIVSQSLPRGDIYLVRQVLQHLSNSDIARVLGRLRPCPHVFVTETQPHILEGPVNPDKHLGAGVRFNWVNGCGRGVELDLPPFNVPIEEVFRVAQDPDAAKEIIVTWKLLPQVTAPGQHRRRASVTDYGSVTRQVAR